MFQDIFCTVALLPNQDVVDYRISIDLYNVGTCVIVRNTYSTVRRHLHMHRYALQRNDALRLEPLSRG